MNKTELIDEVVKKNGASRKEAKEAIELVLDSIKAELSAGRKVMLQGFGTFESVRRSARQGRDPRTGKVIVIPARKVAVFRPSKALKEDLGE